MHVKKIFVNVINLNLKKNSKMLNEDYDYLFKIILIGESGVGKSSLLLRYTDDQFSSNHITTIGVDFKIRSVELGDKIFKLQIWDTAGQERFRSITTSYYRGAHGILLVFDVTDQLSFDNLRNYIENVSLHCNKDVPLLLIGNKSDQVSKRVISSNVAKEYADSLNCVYIETSACTSSNVNEAFIELINLIRVNYRQPIQNRITFSPQQPTAPSSFYRMSRSSKPSCCS